MVSCTTDLFYPSVIWLYFLYTCLLTSIARLLLATETSASSNFPTSAFSSFNPYFLSFYMFLKMIHISGIRKGLPREFFKWLSRLVPNIRVRNMEVCTWISNTINPKLGLHKSSVPVAPSCLSISIGIYLTICTSLLYMFRIPEGSLGNSLRVPAYFDVVRKSNSLDLALFWDLCQGWRFCAQKTRSSWHNCWITSTQSLSGRGGWRYAVLGPSDVNVLQCWCLLRMDRVSSGMKWAKTSLQSRSWGWKGGLGSDFLLSCKEDSRVSRRYPGTSIEPQQKNPGVRDRVRGSMDSIYSLLAW